MFRSARLVLEKVVTTKNTAEEQKRLPQAHTTIVAAQPQSLLPHRTEQLACRFVNQLNPFVAAARGHGQLDQGSPARPRSGHRASYCWSSIALSTARTLSGVDSGPSCHLFPSADMVPSDPLAGQLIAPPVRRYGVSGPAELAGSAAEKEHAIDEQQARQVPGAFVSFMQLLPWACAAHSGNAHSTSRASASRTIAARACRPMLGAHMVRQAPRDAGALAPHGAGGGH